MDSPQDRSKQSVRSDIYSLRHLLQCNMKCTDFKDSILPSMSFSSLEDVITSWLDNNDKLSPSSIHTVFTGLQLTSFCYQLPSSKINILKRLPELYQRFIEHPDILNNSEAYNKVVTSILLQMSTAWDFELFSNDEPNQSRLEILEICKSVFFDLVFRSKFELAQSTLYTASEISTGIIDHLINLAGDSPDKHLSCTSFFLATVLKLPPEPFERMSSIWTHWSSSHMFLNVWSSFLITHAQKYMENMSSPSLPLIQLGRMIQNPLPSFAAGPLTSAITALTEKAKNLSKQSSGLFIKRFPAHLVFDFLLETSLKLLSHTRSPELLSACLDMLAITSFDTRRRPHFQSLYSGFSECILSHSFSSMSNSVKEFIFMSPHGYTLAKTMAAYSDETTSLYLSSFETVPPYTPTNDNHKQFLHAWTMLMGYSTSQNCDAWEYLNQQNTLDSSSIPLLALAAVLPHSSQTSKLIIDGFEGVSVLSQKISKLDPLVRRSLLISLIEHCSCSKKLVDIPDCEGKDETALVGLLYGIQNSLPQIFNKQMHAMWKGKLYSVTYENSNWSITIRDSSISAHLTIEPKNGSIGDFITLPISGATEPIADPISVDIGDIQPQVKDIIPQKASGSSKPHTLITESEPQDFNKPPLLEFLRAMGLLDPREDVSIFTESKRFKNLIRKLDIEDPVPIMRIPVFYISNTSIDIMEQWDSDFVCSFFQPFATFAKLDGYGIRTASHRFLFMRATQDIINCPISIILNSTQSHPGPLVIDQISSEVAISISPYTDTMVRFDIIKPQDKSKYPLDTPLACRIEKVKSVLLFFCFYSSMTSLKGMHAKSAEARSHILNEISHLQRFSPLEFIKKMQQE